MDTKEYHRRKYDDFPEQTHEAIRELIMKTDAPKDKAVLLILLRISEGLEDNTRLTQGLETTVREHNAALATHEADELLLLGKAKTAWWVFTGMLGALSLLAALVLRMYVEEFRTMQVDLVTLKQDMRTVQERLRAEEEVLKSLTRSVTP